MKDEPLRVRRSTAYAMIAANNPSGVLRELGGRKWLFDDTNDFDPPLVVAVTQGSKAVWEVLVGAGHDVNASGNTTGETVLHAAARRGDVKAIKYFLNRGCKVTTNRNGQFPFDVTSTKEALELFWTPRWWNREH